MELSRTRFYTAVSIFSLSLAAGTGVLLRFGLFMGMPSWAQNYVAVRHAHSHLMYFGWVTLGLMALIWHWLPRYTDRPLPRGVNWQMGATAFMALLSYPAFWINGYGLTQIGTAQLPLGAMVAGLNGLTWFVFVGLYVRATRGLRSRPLPVRLWDWAIVLMLVASGGAVGLGGISAAKVANPFLQQFFLHLFLDLFAVGWFDLALLGVLWAWLAEHTPSPEGLPVDSLALLLVPTFLLGMSPMLVTTPMFWLAALANVGAAALLARHLRALWQRRMHLPALVRFSLGVFGVHVAIAVVLLWPGVWQWSGGTQLRIFFLHNLLLGWISSALLGTLLARIVQFPVSLRAPMAVLWVGGVGTMLIALLGLGFVQFWPVPALVWLQLAAWSSVPVLLAVLTVLAGEVRRALPHDLVEPAATAG